MSEYSVDVELDPAGPITVEATDDRDDDCIVRVEEKGKSQSEAIACGGTSLLGYRNATIELDSEPHGPILIMSESDEVIVRIGE